MFTTYNEAADKLANEGRIAGEEMKLPDITSIQFHLGCEAGIINLYPRNTLHNQAKLAHLLCFRSRTHFSKLPKDPLCFEVTIKCLRSCALKESPFVTTPSNSSFRAFRYRYVSDLLPIGSRLRKWGCIANPSGMCRRCGSTEETRDHLTRCGSTEETRDHLTRCPKTYDPSFKEHLK
jgi:hypothetical protein